MIDLARRLVDEVTVRGKTYPLRLSFDRVMRVIELVNDEAVRDRVKPGIIFRILLGDSLENLSYQEQIDLIDQLFEDHIRLSEEREDDRYDLTGELLPSVVAGKEEKPLYSLKHDGDYIYASFMQAYGIDLIDQQGKLHWKKFNALLMGLPENTKFSEVVRVRAWKPSKYDDDDYKRQMWRLQEEYKLPDD